MHLESGQTYLAKNTQGVNFLKLLHPLGVLIVLCVSKEFENGRVSGRMVRREFIPISLVVLDCLTWFTCSLASVYSAG